MVTDFAILGQPDTPHVGNKSQMEMFADQLVTTSGERGDHVNRQLGMNIGLLTWDLSDDQTRTHIEDAMLWNKREDLWSNRNNVEWSDWGGTVVQQPGYHRRDQPPGTDVIGSEIKKGIDA